MPNMQRPRNRTEGLTSLPHCTVLIITHLVQAAQEPNPRYLSEGMPSSEGTKVAKWFAKNGLMDPEDLPFHSVQIASLFLYKAALLVCQGLLLKEHIDRDSYEEAQNAVE